MKQFIYEGNLEIGSSIVLKGEDYSYLCKVRRSRLGDEIQVRTLDGARFLGIFETIESRSCSIKILKEINSLDQAKADNIILCQSLPKASKMDLIIRQVVEAGVKAIYPVETEYCIVKAKDGKSTRWAKIVKEAAQQSDAVIIPAVHKPKPIHTILKDLESDYILVALHQERLSSEGLSDIVKNAMKDKKGIALFVGPEGGFSPKEVDLFKSHSAHIVTLRSNILRTETAGLFGIAGIRTLMEFFCD